LIPKLFCLKQLNFEEDQPQRHESFDEIQEPVESLQLPPNAVKSASKSMRLLIKQSKIMNSSLKSVEERHRKAAEEKRIVLKWRYSARVLNSVFFYLSIASSACIFIWFVIRVNA